MHSQPVPLILLQFLLRFFPISQSCFNSLFPVPSQIILFPDSSRILVLVYSLLESVPVYFSSITFCEILLCVNMRNSLFHKLFPSSNLYSSFPPSTNSRNILDGKSIFKAFKAYTNFFQLKYFLENLTQKFVGATIKAIIQDQQSILTLHRLLRRAALLTAHINLNQNFAICLSDLSAGSQIYF